MKQELAPLDLKSLEERVFDEPTRLIFVGPLHGGPALSSIRELLTPKGKLRFSGTSAKIFADLEPGAPEVPSVSLDSIVRSDAKGLERALLSVLPHVDEIQIGIDDRSDAETRTVAAAYADRVWIFKAEDIGLSAEDWQNNRMHFANARNIGRSMIATPWTLFLDSDEIFNADEDLRAAVTSTLAAVPSLGLDVDIEGNKIHDTQRLARTEFRWVRSSHNLLVFPENQRPGLVRASIVHDTSLRDPSEIARRNLQRAGGIEDLKVEAREGDLNAMYHVAKHLLGEANQGETYLDEALKWVEEFRKKVFPWTEGSEERAHLATCLGIRYYEKNDFVEAELWAFRALLDGPYLDALCLLGDIAENRGSLKSAYVWYTAACATDPAKNAGFSTTQHIRQGRLSGIQKALGLP